MGDRHGSSESEGAGPSGSPRNIVDFDHPYGQYEYEQEDRTKLLSVSKRKILSYGGKELKNS